MRRIRLAQILIGAVLLINVQCALVFLANPAGFAPAYELSGIPGAAAIQGIAVLFLMWNVPYLVAFSNPAKHRLSLFEALAMQGLGLIGESLIFFNIPVAHIVLRASILRFILFDGSGLLALATAAWLLREPAQTLNSHEVHP